MLLHMLLIYQLVGDGCEVDVGLVSAIPLINRVLNLETYVSKMLQKLV
jgi:hypothetical protein